MGKEKCEEHTGICTGIASIETKIDGISVDVKRLDNRINGTFKVIGDHLKEGPKFRDKIIKLETLVKVISDEKLNTTKNSQWRIGLIVGSPAVILVLIRVGEFVVKIIAK